jgi:hypothetical protein
MIVLMVRTEQARFLAWREAFFGCAALGRIRRKGGRAEERRKRGFYCSWTQVRPPSSVTKRRRSREIIVACNVSRASTPIQSGANPGDAATDCVAGGGVTRRQCSPSSVRTMIPARPTTQAIFSDAAAPASRSAVTPLACGCQVCPSSVECSMRPPEPSRQRARRFGEPNTIGWTAFSAKAFSRAGAGAPAAGSKSRLAARSPTREGAGVEGAGGAADAAAVGASPAWDFCSAA